MYLRFFNRGGIPVPYLPSEGIFQLLQAFLIVRIHRNRLLQDIIQVKPCPAVYNKGRLGKNILVHLVQRVPELRHTHPVQVEYHGIEIPGIFATPTPPKVRQRGHDGKVCVKNLRQLRQLIGDGVASGLTVSLNSQGNPSGLWNRHRNSVAFLILEMAFSLKTAHGEDLPVKLKRRHRLQELLQMLIFFTVQIPQVIHGRLLIHSHMITSKRKRIKKKIRCGGERLRAEGGKGRAKERPLRGLKEKVTSPFPPSLRPWK